MRERKSGKTIKIYVGRNVGDEEVLPHLPRKFSAGTHEGI